MNLELETDATVAIAKICLCFTFNFKIAGNYSITTGYQAPDRDLQYHSTVYKSIRGCIYYRSIGGICRRAIFIISITGTMNGSQVHFNNIPVFPIQAVI